MDARRRLEGLVMVALGWAQGLSERPSENQASLPALCSSQRGEGGFVAVSLSGGCRASFMRSTGPFQCWLNCHLSPAGLGGGAEGHCDPGEGSRAELWQPAALQKDLERYEKGPRFLALSPSSEQRLLLSSGMRARMDQNERHLLQCPPDVSASLSNSMPVP